MKNIKENNIRKTLWHIKRHCKNIENNHESEYSKTELFHLKSSIETLSRILNNEKESGTIVSYVSKKATDLPLLFCMVAIVLVK